MHTDDHYQYYCYNHSYKNPTPGENYNTTKKLKNSLCMYNSQQR